MGRLARRAVVSREPMSVRLAVVGKGGSGKTVLTALVVRALAEAGFMVLAVDLDSNPGLAVTLGLPVGDTPLADEAVEERPGTPFGWGLASHLTPAEAVRRYATPVADKVVFMGFGNNAALDTPVLRYLTAVREVAERFEEPGWLVVSDLAAGPTTPYEGYTRQASCALVAVEPTPTAILTAQGLIDIMAEDGTPAKVVVTKVRDDDDLARVAKELEVFAAIPFDPDIARLEREGSLATLPASSPALEAARRLVDRLGL